MRWLFTWPTVSAYSIIVICASVLPLTMPSPILWFDKYLHAVTYFLLSWLLAHTLVKKNLSHPCLISFSYAFFLGAFIECVQYFIPYRFFEFQDLLANAAGAGAGLLIRKIQVNNAR
jgi:VanZ family protein